MVINKGIAAAEWLADAPRHKESVGRPLVTLSYAQSLDGCLAAEPGIPFPLSGKASLMVTHALRAAHDAILIGINTVLADDPQLNVRYVVGRNPQPVILDRTLKMPMSSRLMQRTENLPWLFCGQGIRPDQYKLYEQSGAKVFPVLEDAQTKLDLGQVLGILANEGINSVLVEGGSQVITSFLRGNWVDWAVITIAPFWLGGYRALSSWSSELPYPALIDPVYEIHGRDVLIGGKITLEG